VATFATPEEAARAAFGEKSVRFVGAVVRGDEAVVGHWVEGHGYSDTETTTCFRAGDGWEAASSGNGNGAHIITARDRVTFVSWGPAPEGAVAVRYSMGDREQVVPVEEGFFFAVFDDLPYQEPRREDFPLPRDGSARGYMRVGARGVPRGVRRRGAPGKWRCSGTSNRSSPSGCSEAAEPNGPTLAWASVPD
jgi:hypothetical protein